MIKTSDVLPEMGGGDGFINARNPVLLSELGHAGADRNIARNQGLLGRGGVAELVPVPQLPAALWAWDNNIRTQEVLTSSDDKVAMTIDFVSLSPENRNAVLHAAHTYDWIDVGISVEATSVEFSVHKGDFPGVTSIQQARIRAIQELLLKRMQSVLGGQDRYIDRWFPPAALAESLVHDSGIDPTKLRTKGLVPYAEGYLGLRYESDLGVFISAEDFARIHDPRASRGRHPHLIGW